MILQSRAYIQRIIIYSGRTARWLFSTTSMDFYL